MGDFVNGEVFADSPLMGLPHEGALCGVELGQEGAVALGGSKPGFVGDRFVEPSSGRVDFGGGGGHSEGGHALAMFHQERKWRETGLDGQDGDRGREETIRDPSLDVSPEGVEPILHFHEGCEEIGAI